MYFLFSLIPATLWVVLGYFILFSATKAQGGTKVFGLVLAAWVFVIGASFALLGAYVTSAGLHPLGGVMEGMEGMHGPSPGQR